MLFNSYVFLFLFLPLVFAGYFLLHRYTRASSATNFLIVASLFFYSYWNIIYLPLIVGSIIINYTVGQRIEKTRWSNGRRKTVLVAGIAANLLLLGYFKYADFFIANWNGLFGGDVPLLHVVLPLAISFFTFQQIAYLVDSYKGVVAEHSFQQYVLFVVFFPQLISGPIVHHKEMMPQFKDRANRHVNYRNISIGLFLLVIGLFKKVVIADTFAEWANAGYAVAQSLTFFEAWITSLSYSFQLYFDFSGYMDMALGIAYLFNIKLPLNFNSPYKARNIQDFWRRWHMTLSRFLRDYIYIPLGGSRRGFGRTIVNALMVFLIGGLWHGASWTFVVWGALHGIAISIMLVWRRFKISMSTFLAWFITFQFVNVTWVFFRAESFADAIGVLKGMVGIHGVIVPEGVAGLVPVIGDVATLAAPLKTMNISDASTVVAWVAVSLGVVALARNSVEWSKRLQPTVLYGAVMLVLFLAAFFELSTVSEFLYFNF